VERINSNTAEGCFPILGILKNEYISLFYQNFPRILSKNYMKTSSETVAMFAMKHRCRFAEKTLSIYTY
jgi:hypothetical protein